MPAEICTNPWKFAAEPFRMVGDLYYVGTTDVSAHILRTRDGLVLFDTMYPQTVYLLLEGVRKLGFDTAEIRHIIHSHAHYDHLGGTRAIQELTGAKTYLGAADLFILSERPELTWAAECGFEFHETFEVDVPLQGDEKLEIGGVSIECVPTAGHTPGSISYFFEAVEEGQTLRVGMHGGPGLNTQSDEYLDEQGLPKSWRENYWTSLQELKKQRVDVFAGIHPDQSDTLGRHARRGEGGNPFVDPGAWPVFLTGLEAKFTEQFG
jgi:metallo-beta-lactamase class B